jgi:hypothetical protein
MYVRGNWNLNKSERRKIETNETRFLRLVSGCTLTHLIRNTTVLDEFTNIHILLSESKLRNM